MKYCKGYPVEIRIDGEQVTLHDLERNMLSLYWDERIGESERDSLMDKYKEERMRYLDSVFQPSEEDCCKLKEVDRRYAEARRRMEETHRRIADRELLKRRQGEKAAVVLVSHLEVWNLEDTDRISYSDEECELWDMLFEEDRDYVMGWGIDTCHSELREGGVREWSSASRSCDTPEAEDAACPCSRELYRLKTSYRVAWQDILKIARFHLTMNMYY